MDSIQAISFDAAGTLIRLRRPVGETYAEVAARHGLALDAGAATRAFYRIWKRLPERADGLRAEDDAGFWREIVRQVLTDCGCAPELGIFEALFIEAYERYRGAAEWELFPGVAETLAALVPRFPLAVTSNYDGRLRATLHELGVAEYFQAVIVSSEVGSDKPNARIFEATIHALGVPAGEILHLGDDPAHDVEGAIQAGMQARLVREPAVELPPLAERLRAGDYSICSRRS